MNKDLQKIPVAPLIKRVHIMDKRLFDLLHEKIHAPNTELKKSRNLRTVRSSEAHNIFLLSHKYCEMNRLSLVTFRKNKMQQSVLFYYVGNSKFKKSFPDIIDFSIPEPVDEAFLNQALQHGFELLGQRHEIDHLRTELNSRNVQIQELAHFGQRLMMEKDLYVLLNLILRKSIEVAKADAGSLYLVEENEEMGKYLRFMITQNDSISMDFKEFTIPISRKSISGYVSDTGNMLNIPDVYWISKESEYSFNKDFDKKLGYRTKSMLVVPLRNHLDEIIGVLQLINCKLDWKRLLKERTDFEENIVPFDEENIEMVSALAGHAAISIENNLLYRSIERLFEGFVNASVTAIESRDPSTSGNSSRVAILTEELAKSVTRINTGPLKQINFNRDQIKEIRYASLLHDFWKVGVREQVLLKAKKLYPYELTEVLFRLGYLKNFAEIKSLKKKIRFLLDYGTNNYHMVFREMENELDEKLGGLEELMSVIKELNEPTVMEIDRSALLSELAGRTFYDYNNEIKTILKEGEVKALSIKRGSLDTHDRLEIESHVTHTFNFLSKVPWTKDIRKIPDIAHAHHEKLNGDCYPNKMVSGQIPIQAKLMTVSDIFDALTAADRPYKKAVPYEKALTILQYEVKDNHIDPNIVKIFIEAGIYKSVIKSN